MLHGTPHRRSHLHVIATGANDKGTWIRLIKSPAKASWAQGTHGLDVGDMSR